LGNLKKKIDGLEHLDNLKLRNIFRWTKPFGQSEEKNRWTGAFGQSEVKKHI
jgi:hypothetical protein